MYHKKRPQTVIFFKNKIIFLKQFQLLLTDYLDIQNSNVEQQTPTTFTDQTANINTFFNRRKPQS